MIYFISCSSHHPKAEHEAITCALLSLCSKALVERRGDRQQGLRASCFSGTVFAYHFWHVRVHNGTLFALEMSENNLFCPWKNSRSSLDRGKSVPIFARRHSRHSLVPQPRQTRTHCSRKALPTIFQGQTM